MRRVLRVVSPRRRSTLCNCRCAPTVGHTSICTSMSLFVWIPLFYPKVWQQSGRCQVVKNSPFVLSGKSCGGKERFTPHDTRSQRGAQIHLWLSCWVYRAAFTFSFLSNEFIFQCTAFVPPIVGLKILEAGCLFYNVRCAYEAGHSSSSAYYDDERKLYQTFGVLQAT